MRKAALHNLGCKVNAYETEAMQQLLEEAGYEIVPFGEEADVYVVNTCSVTNIADRKSRQMLHRAKKLNPRAVVAAVGCYAQSAKAELEKDGSVDLIVGNNKKAELARLLDECFAGRETALEAVLDIGSARDYENLSVSGTGEHTRAFIKVQDGCNQFCSYCIIPYARGRVRSREPEKVWEEVENLARSGYREIVLTGIHLSSYGIDFPQERRISLLELVERLHGTEGIERIRLGSLEPRIITEEFAGRLSALPKVCPHFHLSLQSGCDSTLLRMNRRYTTEEYLEKCRILRRFFHNPAITTDVIVGFPGETEEEFARTREFLEKVRFYEMHVFKYSRREKTRAASMPDQIPESVKADRSSLLIGLGNRMSLEYRKQFLGRETEILTEEKMVIGGEEYWTGYTGEYIKAAARCAEEKRGVLVSGVLERMMSDEVVYLKEKNS